MHHVSCRACLDLLDGAARIGFASPDVLARAGIAYTELCDPSRDVPWTQLVALFDALEELGAGPREFERIGHDILTSPWSDFLRQVARTVLTPRQLYRIVYRRCTRTLFEGMPTTARYLSDGRLEWVVELPDDAQPCAGFHWVVKGVLASVPALIDLPRATVTSEIVPQWARHLISLPPQRSVLAQARRVARTALMPWTILDVLAIQQHELRERYQALARSRESLQQVIDRTPDAVVVYRDGRVVYANQAMTTALRITGAALVGRELLELVHPADRDAARAHLSRATGTAEPRELRFCRTDGATLMLEVAPVENIFFDDREALLAVARDVTERRRLEEHLVRSDRLSSLGRMAAGVAHELNNPLAYVNLNLQLLERAVDRIADDATRVKARKSLEAAKHGVDRAATIVRDLRTFSRPEQETLESLSIDEVVTRAAEMVRKQIEIRAQLILELSPDAGRVRGNRARLEQVLVNLLNNAGGSFSSLRGVDENYVIVRTRAGRGETIIEVQDNGSGIPENIRANVFDPFFTTKPIKDGTGLGLAICHGIVTRLGGTIRLESEVGSGTTFLVTLPADVGTAHQPQKARSRDHRSRPESPVRKRVLLIDDEPELASILSSLIEERHDVEVASSARAALALLKDDDRFDYVLCDLMMVEMTGMDLYATLRERGSPVADRMVFMTGGAFTPNARDFISRVPNRCLEKPFTVDKIFEVLDELDQPVARA